MITIALLTLLALIIIAWWTTAHRRQRAARERHDDIPLFTVPASSPPRIARPAAMSSVTRRTPPAMEAVGARPEAESPTGVDVHPRFSPSAPTIRTRDGAVSTLARPASTFEEPPDSEVTDAPGEAVDGASIHYWRPADGTLQFLPGRLEVVAGRDAGQEIRFVRTAGPDGTCVTFGRADGAPYRHVQLREPTVSRAHARMLLEHAVPDANGSVTWGSGTGTNARWRLENLSATNPVIVNGRPLEARGGLTSSVILSDGDRIEMGEVAFVFHSR